MCPEIQCKHFYVVVILESILVQTLCLFDCAKPVIASVHQWHQSQRFKPGKNKSRPKVARLQEVIQVLIIKIKRGKRHQGKHIGNGRDSVTKRPVTNERPLRNYKA